MNNELVLDSPICKGTNYNYHSSVVSLHTETQTNTSTSKYLFPETKDFQEQLVYNLWTENYEMDSFLENGKTKKLIDLEGSFNNQMTFLLSKLDENVNQDLLRNFFDEIAEKILQVYPEDIGIEISFDKSLIYSIVKNGIKTYIEISPEDEIHDQAMLTVVDKNGNLNSIIGSIEEILEKFERQFEDFKQTFYIPTISA